jgi:hypothetical protein
MTNVQRLRTCRRERKAILKAIQEEVIPIYAKYKPALDANKIKEAHLLLEIAKDRAEDRFVKDLPF